MSNDQELVEKVQELLSLSEVGVDPSLLFSHGILPKQRVIYLGANDAAGGGEEAGTITHQTSDHFIKGLMALGAGPVIVIINNVGGSVPHGFAIYDALKAHSEQYDVIAVCYGTCWSMATAILQAATLRLLSPRSTLLVHDGQRYASGSSQREFSSHVKFMALMDRWYEEVLEGRTGKSRKQIRSWCRKESFFTPTQAIEAGMADGVWRGPLDSLFNIHSTIVEVPEDDESKATTSLSESTGESAPE